MKKIEISNNKSFIKKIFIKICRIFGFEIIDQATFKSPTLGKDLNETLSVPGKKSIKISLGRLDIKRKVRSIKILLRTCTAELIMDQNKRRLFDREKNDYTFRTLKSLIRSIQHAKKEFDNVQFELVITDTNSEEKDIVKMRQLLEVSNLNHRLLIVDLKNFENKIKTGYSKAKFSNMANFYNSLLIAKNEENDLIYFVEDDYIHSLNTITEMIYAYEKFCTLFDKEIILLPSDYPYLYTKDENTKIYLGEKNHWRLVSESLVTFMTSKTLILENFNKLERMGIEWIDPWEKPLHEIYNAHPCFSPIPSLAYHCANVNSVFGVSPNIDLKKLWDENN
tara:strand:- start:222 stop:1232 length:1011 start_codon:yes stop_codon:yes gene_type:complete